MRRLTHSCVRACVCASFEEAGSSCVSFAAWREERSGTEGEESSPRELRGGPSPTAPAPAGDALNQGFIQPCPPSTAAGGDGDALNQGFICTGES